MRPREAQTLEWKKSLSEWQEATQSAVAFANTGGGEIQFGVAPDGTVVGVQPGERTLEKLATRFRHHIYPDLPVEMVESLEGGKWVIRVIAPKDSPTVCGVYLWSSKAIDPHAPVPTASLQAYRRVGRMNQKADFMQLRAELPSDPRLDVSASVSNKGLPFPQRVAGNVVAEAGSATAYDIRIRMEPELCRSSNSALRLPTLDNIRTMGFTFDCSGVMPPAGDLQVIAAYRDSRALQWESSVVLRLIARENSPFPTLQSVAQTRHIVAFPPKLSPGPGH